MGSRAASQALVPGRVVLVTNRSTGLPELGAVCGTPASASKGIQLGNTASSGKQQNQISAGKCICCSAVTGLYLHICMTEQSILCPQHASGEHER